MNQPAVALTDWAVAAETAVFARLLLRDPAGDAALRSGFALLFAALSAATLLGGVVHAFFPDRASLGHVLLWPLALLAVGAASFGAWESAAQLSLAERGRRRVRALAWGQLGLLAALALFVTQDFRLAIASYLPAALFLLAAFLRAPGPRAGLGALGLLVTLLATALQQLRIGVHPVYFDHNALYHVIQAAGLAGIFLAARGASRSRALARRGGC